MNTHCSVPAKLILSGEHAVLYQCPALSMAINLKTHCRASFQSNPESILTLKLVNFQQEYHFTFDERRAKAVEIEQRFQLFTQNKTAIESVLTNPIDLILVVLHHFEKLTPLKTGQWQLSIESEAPIGRGLGSSAAVIVSLLSALIKQHELPFTRKDLLDLALQIECRQHGKSSGIDPATIIVGGLLQYHTDQPFELFESGALNAWLVDTGKPLSSTGQCVEFVKTHHASNQTLWAEFAKTTQQMATSWQAEDRLGFNQAIQHNHQLLIQIGVVPAKVQQFISTLEQQYHAVAKTCGAGAISGENAGMVLVISEQAPVELCQTYQYPYYPLSLDDQGVLCETFNE